MKKLLLPFVAAVMFTSCGNDNANKGDSTATSSSSATQTAKEETPEKKENFLADASALQKAENDLKGLPKFKGKSLNVFQNVHFYGDGRIMIELQDPDKPENIDHYEYNEGKWSEPQPVQISGDGNMKDNISPLDNVKFAAVSEIYKNWNEKAKSVEGALDKPLDHVYYLLVVHTQDRYWNASSIEGTREKYNIQFNLDGSIKTFEKM